MKPKIIITREILPAGCEALSKKGYDLRMNSEDRAMSKEEILGAIKDADALLCMLNDPIDRDVILAGKELRVISTHAVGYNNIDLHAAKEKGIVVTNTPGVLTETTAETAFALMIACARRICESDRWLRTNTFRGWTPTMFLGMDLHKKTLGIIGLGRIGRAVAKRARFGFEMNIIYNDNARDAAFEEEYSAAFASLEDLLRRSDFVSLHTPLNPSTHHLIGAHEFSLMKPTACLINTARGPVVDERALIAALQEKTIFAAGLDVYEEEPFIPQELLALENAVLLPHIGSASIETRSKMSLMAAENIIAVLEGKEPHARVLV